MRRCADCQEEKTVRGIWFLVTGVDGRSGDGSDFLCEECYSERSGSLRGSNLTREPGPGGAQPH